MPENVSWDPNFGQGLNVQNENTGEFRRITAQRPIGMTDNSIVYGDESGRLASLSGLSAEEVELLRQKHGG